LADDVGRHLGFTSAANRQARHGFSTTVVIEDFGRGKHPGKIQQSLLGKSPTGEMNPNNARKASTCTVFHQCRNLCPDKHSIACLA